MEFCISFFMIKYSNLTNNIRSGNFTDIIYQNTDKFQKIRGGGGGCYTPPSPAHPPPPHLATHTHTQPPLDTNATDHELLTAKLNTYDF